MDLNRKKRSSPWMRNMTKKRKKAITLIFRTTWIPALRTIMARRDFPTGIQQRYMSAKHMPHADLVYKELDRIIYGEKEVRYPIAKPLFKLIPCIQSFVKHEFRTPVSIVTTMQDVIIKWTGLLERRRSHVDRRHSRKRH